jgi:parallel beta-helix repeat protein
LFQLNLKAQVYRIYINEFLASNVSINADIVDFDDYSDWIELYNDEDFEVNIGNYFITDNLNNPTKYKFPEQVIIPSKGFLLLWADGYNDIPGRTYRRDYYPYDYYTTKYYHLSFAISRGSEEIALFNQDTLLIDSVTFGYQERDISMGRKTDGSRIWNYFGDPTPGISNLTAGIGQIEFSVSPIVSPESGFFEGAQSVSINASSSDYLIKYTLDGSRPTLNSETYTQPLQITETKVLRVRVYEQGKLPSKIFTYSYFINETTDISVISLSAFPETLWDEEKGIYDNQYKSREIPVTIEYFEKDRTKGFSVDAGLRMTGQASLDYPQKSFTIYTDENYGYEAINYQVFPNRRINNFTELYLRNGGVPDNRLTMFRDGALQSLVLNKIDVDCQDYVPTALFINGEYWGIYNIREKIGSPYLAYLNNINPDDIDLLEYNLNKIPEVVEGQGEEFIDLINFFEQNDLSIQQNYEYIESKIDIDEYINYYITEIYFDNVFWLNQNVRIWKERKDGKKWRWILYDTDNAFGAEGPGTSRYQTNTLQLVTSPVQNNVYPLWSTLTFRKLIQNLEFKKKFIQKFSSYLNSIFLPDTILATIERFKSGINTEITHHINRWRIGGIINGLPPIYNYAEWERNIEKMKQFALYRLSYQRQHILSNFNLSGTSTINITADLEMGKVLINDFENVKGLKSGTYFKDIPIELKAVPEVGYRFVKWIGISNELDNPVNFVVVQDTINITAQFEPFSVSIIQSNINQNTILTKSNSPYYAQGNITVDPHVTLMIESGVKILMPEESSILVYGKLIIDGTSENPVTIAPNENSQSWGALCFINSTDSSIVRNLKLIGATTGIDFTRDKAAISSYNANLSLEGITVEVVEAPIFLQLGNVSVKNCSLSTKSPGDLINIKNTNFVLVEDCDLMGNDAFDSDGIDFDHIKSGVIRGNKIYNIYGFNSDAIDLGEAAENILVENNIIFNVADKGISIGGGSNAIIKRNAISNCGQGAGIKDFNSYGYFENNTFYANTIAVACFEKNIGHGGGRADVVNCIIANSKESSVFVDELSYLKVSYSLSNTNEIEGINNIFGDPLLLNNFRLSVNSPAINKGNPSLPRDPDGSIADIGAFPYDANNQLNLLINEIHYNPSEGDEYEFVEFVNAGASSININGYKIAGDINYQFGDKTISPNEYFVIVKNRNLYSNQGYKVFQWDNGNLKNKQGNLLLTDSDDDTIDFVDFDCRFWWPELPNGQGPSLELKNTSLENMVSSNWQASETNGGSPGKQNYSTINKIFVNEFLAANDSNNSDECGEYDDWIEIYNGNDIPINIGGFFVTDDLVNPLMCQIPADSVEKTTILPKGYLLLWMDGQPEQGALHMSFKLDKEGEQVGLFQVIENLSFLIDSVTFSEQSKNISFGRRPDGSENWCFISKPSPLDSNGSEIVDPEIPSRYLLFQNYPNPFNPSTTIKYDIPAGGFVTIKVYDILGSEVETLLHDYREPGKYELEWNAGSFASGVYFYNINAGDFHQTKKMILLR